MISQGSCAKKRRRHPSASMGGDIDNIFNERARRTVKHEEVYIQGYQVPDDAQAGLEEYFPFFTDRRYPSGLSIQDSQWNT